MYGRVNRQRETLDECCGDRPFSGQSKKAVNLSMTCGPCANTQHSDLEVSLGVEVMINRKFFGRVRDIF